MPKTKAANVLPYELLAFLRAPLAKRLISLRALQILYIKSATIISKRSRRFLITAIPAVQRQLRWAMLLALLRTYFLFMRRIILDPRSGFERSLNKHGGWLLLVALRERFKARVKKGAENALGGSGGGLHQDFVTPPTSPAVSISSGGSFISVPDYFPRPPDADPILRAVRQVIPDATGYKVVVPRPLPEEGQENASNELARRISGRNVETQAYHYKDGIIRTPTTSDSGRQKVVSLVILEDYGDRKSIKGAVTVDTNVGNKVETKKIEELGVPFAEALAY